MAADRSKNYISPEKYLELEKTSPVKHEYIDGHMYVHLDFADHPAAMSEASDAHNTLTFNLPALLKSHLRAHGCWGYGCDMKLRLESKNIFYYPDLFVTCDQRDRTERYFKRYPQLIIEVLSDSTEKFDRSKKFADYRSLETLQEYVLISQDEMNIEVFERNLAGRWELYVFKAGEQVEFASLDFRTPLEAIYEDVIFDSSEANLM